MPPPRRSTVSRASPAARWTSIGSVSGQACCDMAASGIAWTVSSPHGAVVVRHPARLDPETGVPVHRRRGVSAEHPLEEARFLGVRIADTGTERRDRPPYRARI